jgi:hypothetical protein
VKDDLSIYATPKGGKVAISIVIPSKRCGLAALTPLFIS